MFGSLSKSQLATLAACGYLAFACQSTPATIEPHAAPPPPKAKAQKASKAPTRLASVTVTPEVHPLSALDPKELARIARENPAGLGSLSVGRPNRGRLFNGVQMPDGPYWEVRDPDRSWATRETVESLARAIRVVATTYPDTPRLQIGDMSRKKGGYFRPHRSHQSGRDADVGFYYLDRAAWYVKANRENLDVKRTWALVKALLAEGSVEYIFMDRSIQALLKEHARKVEPTSEWLNDVFEEPGKKGEPVIRHAWGHQTHMHVRFYCDHAQQTSRLAYKLLGRYGKL